VAHERMFKELDNQEIGRLRSSYAPPHPLIHEGLSETGGFRVCDSSIQSSVLPNFAWSIHQEPLEDQLRGAFNL
jgi:hypothetical protein